jgi:O-antigen ligase
MRVPTGAALLLTLVGLAVWVGRSVEVGPIDLQAIQVVTLALLIGVLLEAARSGSAPLTWLRPPAALFTSAIVVAVSLILIAATLSATHAIEPFSIVRFVARYALGLVLFVALLQLLRVPERSRFLERALWIGALLSVGVAALGYFVPALGAWTIRYGDRAQALLNHPNQLAMVLTALVPVAFVRALGTPRRPGPWLLVLIMSAGVAFTGSKVNLAILAGMLPVLAFLAALLQRGSLRKIGSLAGFTFGSLAAVWVAFLAVRRFNPRTIETLERLFVEPASTTAVATRSEMWRTALEEGVRNPWVGVGAEHAGYYIGFSHAHNVFLEFFLTMGLAGLVGLGALVTTVVALSVTSILWALTKTTLPRGQRLALLGVPVGLLAYIASNQSSDSFGGTTLPILWIGAAWTLAQLDHAGRPPAGGRGAP